MLMLARGVKMCETRKVKITYRGRRILSVLLLLMAVAGWPVLNPVSYEKEVVLESAEEGTLAPLGATSESGASIPEEQTARYYLEKLEVKGRAPKTGYARTEFYSNWPNVNGCSLRQIIIKRELGETAVLDGCDVISGSFTEPYTGSEMIFYQKSDFSSKIQIDHIVALSDAWQKGAQYKTKEERYAMATDPLNLIAVDSSANQQKSDGDAATWLPPNKSFRCQYVARQVSVKYKYALWVTEAERDAIAGILETCPNEPVVGV